MPDESKQNDLIDQLNTDSEIADKAAILLQTLTWFYERGIKVEVSQSDKAQYKVRLKAN